jgi:hypothetical protein
MTDYPRFEPVRGEPDVAHKAYYGGPLVSLVFRLVDRWRGRVQELPQGYGASPHRGTIEVHERPPVLAPTAALPGGADAAVAAERPLYQVAPDEGFSRSFLVGSARTMKLQTGLLATFVAVLVMLVAQGLRMPQQASEQASRRPAIVAKSPVQGQNLPSHVLP